MLRRARRGGRRPAGARAGLVAARGVPPGGAPRCAGVPSSSSKRHAPPLSVSLADIRLEAPIQGTHTHTHRHTHTRAPNRR